MGGGSSGHTPPPSDDESSSSKGGGGHHLEFSNGNCCETVLGQIYENSGGFRKKKRRCHLKKDGWNI